MMRVGVFLGGGSCAIFLRSEPWREALGKSDQPWKSSYHVHQPHSSPLLAQQAVAGIKRRLTWLCGGVTDGALPDQATLQLRLSFEFSPSSIPGTRRDPLLPQESELKALFFAELSLTTAHLYDHTMYRGPGYGGRSKATANILCQKCLKRGHYSYECKVSAQERPYKSRPSRTQQLLNPQLKPKLSTEVPNDLLRK